LIISKNKNKKSDKPMDFSKKILTWIFIGWLVLIPISFILMWKFGDLTPLITMWGGLIAETATSTSFYFWKAKNENLAKFSTKNTESENWKNDNNEM
jgi:hypothetical protein